MIKTAKTLVTETYDPYRNLAVESCLLDSLRPDECILYLWQNAKTVVIGRNQNAYRECRIEKLTADGGRLARRGSGGGSVYHDMGNLNFTFLANEGDYDVARQLSVIVRALEGFGVSAEISGRNDITADGRKFSGNAYYRHKGRCYHHGAILVDTDMTKMSEYLRVSAEKLRTHGVESVRSRVVNLRELQPAIGIGAMKAALIRAFGEVYDVATSPMNPDDLDREALAGWQDRYASAEWLYGRHMRADYTFGRRFSWGEVEICLAVQGETITDALVFSDAMDGDIAEVLTGRFVGLPFRATALLDALDATQGKHAAQGEAGEYAAQAKAGAESADAVQAESEAEPRVLRDIMDLIKEQDIWR